MIEKFKQAIQELSKEILLEFNDEPARDKFRKRVLQEALNCGIPGVVVTYPSEFVDGEFKVNIHFLIKAEAPVAPNEWYTMEIVWQTSDVTFEEI
jgi:hypothetical protein